LKRFWSLKSRQVLRSNATTTGIDRNRQESTDCAVARSRQGSFCGDCHERQPQKQEDKIDKIDKMPTKSTPPEKEKTIDGSGGGIGGFLHTFWGGGKEGETNEEKGNSEEAIGGSAAGRESMSEHAAVTTDETNEENGTGPTDMVIEGDAASETMLEGSAVTPGVIDMEVDESDAVELIATSDKVNHESWTKQKAVLLPSSETEQKNEEELTCSESKTMVWRPSDDETAFKSGEAFLKVTDVSDTTKETLDSVLKWAWSSEKDWKLPPELLMLGMKSAIKLVSEMSKDPDDLAQSEISTGMKQYQGGGCVGERRVATLIGWLRLYFLFRPMHYQADDWFNSTYPQLLGHLTQKGFNKYTYRLVEPIRYVK